MDHAVRPIAAHQIAARSPHNGAHAMTDIKLITDPAAVTPEWLTGVLRASGALTSGRVESVSHELFGAGMVGDNARFHLSYDGGEGPATVVGKFPTADEVSRGASVATRTYEVESRFSQELRHRVAIPQPTPTPTPPPLTAH